MLTIGQISLFEIFSMIICLFLSGFFSGAEAVLMTVNIDRAKQLIDEGGKNAKILLFMTNKSNDLLATILVGNNIVNILAASLTTTIAARIFHSNAIAISTGITTILILIFGEIIPKTFARSHAEVLSIYVLKILKVIYFVLYPFVKSLVWIINQVLGDRAEISGRLVTKNDIEYYINKAEKEKTMDSKQLDLITSVLEFPTIKVKDIMIPRLEIKYISLDKSPKDIIHFIAEDRHSRYPVIQGDLDNIKGFLHVKDLVSSNGYNVDNINIVDYIKPAFFVYEHMKIQAVFDYMKTKKVHLALVKDENGLIVGIVTLEDIIEEIMGEIEDEHDAVDLSANNVDADNFNLEEGIFVEGSILLRELDNDYDIKIPLNDNFSTIAGFLLDMLGNNFPESGQIIVWEGYSFELTTVHNQEIKVVKIKDVDGEKHLFSKKEVADINHEDND